MVAFWSEATIFCWLCFLIFWHLARQVQDLSFCQRLSIWNRLWVLLLRGLPTLWAVLCNRMRLTFCNLLYFIPILGCNIFPGWEKTSFTIDCYFYFDSNAPIFFYSTISDKKLNRKWTSFHCFNFLWLNIEASLNKTFNSVIPALSWFLQPYIKLVADRMQNIPKIHCF